MKSIFLPQLHFQPIVCNWSLYVTCGIYRQTSSQMYCLVSLISSSQDVVFCVVAFRSFINISEECSASIFVISHTADPEFNSMLYYAATSHTLKVLQTQICELGCKAMNIP
jgi:hypothetical protein